MKLYSELAAWWPLISSPSDYQEEAAFCLSLLAEAVARQPATLLELGSGGGNNALHMKSAFASVTLVDLSLPMLEVSRQLNPDCEHLQGDMRSVRLGRAFDVVFIHDAIMYMTTLDALRQAIETAFIHCKPGGLALFVPDFVRETFQPATDHGGEDGQGRSARYLEWTYDPDAADTAVTTEYVFVLRQAGEPVRVVHEQHVEGLFARDDWLYLLRAAGFQAELVMDPYERPIFVGRRP